MDSLQILNSANNIFFKSITDILNLEKTKESDLINLYTALHHYCELMMRYLVIKKDPSKNKNKESNISVNASELPKIINDLYSTNFFNDNKLNYLHFISFFKYISNLRNTYAHTGYIESLLKNKNDILDDYILCFYSLNKNDDFVESYCNFLKQKIVCDDYMEWFYLKPENKEKYNELVKFKKSNYYIKSINNEKISEIFNLTKFKNVIFGIEKKILNITCPNCKNKTLIKENNESFVFKCYICKHNQKMISIKCNECILNGIRKSYSYTDNHICAICTPNNENYGLLKLIKKHKGLPHNYEQIQFKKRNPICYKYSLFHSPKNSYNKIKNIKKIELFFKNYNYDLYINCNTNNEYLTYWRNLLSYKHCIYIYKNKTIPIKSYYPVFNFQVDKDILYYFIIDFINIELDEIIKKIKDQKLIDFINYNLFNEIIIILKKNIYNNLMNYDLCY